MARYWRGTTSNSWGDTNNWSATSGGATGVSVPTSADDVTFDGNGNNPCDINTSSRSCLSFTVQGTYTNTITHTQQLTVSGNVTLHTGYTIAGSGELIINTTSTITSGGKTWPNGITLSGLTTTYTISGNLSITGLLTISGRNAVVNKTTTETITVAGGLLVTNANSSTITGTIKVILTGGTFSGATGQRYTSFDIDFQGTITIGANIGVGGTCTWTYVSGTVTAPATLLINFVSGTFTMNTSGISWNAISVTGTSPVISLTSNLSATSLTTAVTTTINKSASETATFSNGITINGPLQGTAKIILTGGTWSGSNTTGISNDLDLQGNVTISGNVYYRTGTLSYISGTITVTSSTLKITGSCTLNTNGMSWNNVNTTVNGPTITLTSNFTATGSFTCFDAGTANTATTTINRTTAETWSCGGITCNNRVAGTAKIILTGGTWSSGLNSTGLYIQNNLDFAGNVTLSNNVSYNTGTIKYVSGTITTTGSNLYVGGGGLTNTFDTNGITFSTVTFGINISYTINSLLSSSTIDLSLGGQTFAGTAGFTCATLSCSAIAASTISFKESVTYTITTLFDCHTSRLGSIILFTSSHASLRASILMPNNGNNLCNVLANFTRIDASGGRSICTFGGTVTDCLNVVSYTDYKNISNSDL